MQIDETAGSPPPPFVLAITADTHLQHDAVALPDPSGFPQGTVSVLMHCGDFESSAKLEAWLATQLHRGYSHALVVCGNHDKTYKALDRPGTPGWRDAPPYQVALARSIAAQTAIKGFRGNSVIRSAVMLNDAAVTLASGEHTLRVHGMPYHVRQPGTNTLTNCHFQHSEEDLAKPCERIDDATDVLMTHAGPIGCLDLANGGQTQLGSAALRERVEELPRLAAHAFGHVHAAQPVPADHEPVLQVVAQRKKKGVLVPVKRVKGLDTRAVRRAATGALFVNAAGMKVPAGQHRLVHADDPQAAQRAPVVMRLDRAVNGVWRASVMASVLEHSA